MKIDFIPKKDSDFGLWMFTIMSYLKTRLEMFGIPEEVFTFIGGLFAEWETKYQLAEAPDTRTKPAISSKNAARAVLEKEFRGFNNEYLRFNHLVTNLDRENMGLPVPSDTRTAAPVPVTFPEYRVDSPIIRRLTIHFRDNGSTSKAKPAGVHGAEIKWGFLDFKPASVDELIFSSFDTRSPLTLEFTEDQRGKTVYFCLRWENTRGEKGPWSGMSSAIVP